MQQVVTQLVIASIRKIGSDVIYFESRHRPALYSVCDFSRRPRAGILRAGNRNQVSRNRFGAAPTVGVLRLELPELRTKRLREQLLFGL
jgi:hypothetical protein